MDLTITIRKDSPSLYIAEAPGHIDGTGITADEALGNFIRQVWESTTVFQSTPTPSLDINLTLNYPAELQDESDY